MNVIVAAQPDGKPADFNLAEGTMRYLVTQAAASRITTTRRSTSTAIFTCWTTGASRRTRRIPDLSKFRKRGGKLLMTYGWADSILQPMMGVNYYEQAVAKNGPDTTEFFRLFMVPGMAHCGGGIGPDRHDSMTAMIDWVEKGKAPDSMRGEPRGEQPGGAHAPALPLSAGGALLGQGSIDDAANFRCVAP